MSFAWLKIIKFLSRTRVYNKPDDIGTFDDDRFDLHWGNLLAQAGLNYRFKDNLSSEFTAAYTRFFSGMKHDYKSRDKSPDRIDESHTLLNTDNNINDWIFRGDFDWRPNDDNRVRFGAGYTRHSFLPARTTREYKSGNTHTLSGTQLGHTEQMKSTPT